MELLYLVTGGDFSKDDYWFKQKAHKFLHYASYLFDKRKVEIEEQNEKIKNKR